jgi:two-component system NarL family response regulator
MCQGKSIRVLILDPHQIWREGLMRIIERQTNMRVVAETSTGQEVISLFRQHQPDVLLMDWQMPDRDGIEVITTLRAEFPAARILVLTSSNGEEDIYQALRTGVQGYLLKDIQAAELLEAIRRVYQGQRYLSPAVAVILMERVQKMELTPREMDVLSLMARGLSNQEIGEALFIVEGTVKVHVSNILRKLMVQDRTQAVTAALKRGLLHLP